MFVNDRRKSISSIARNMLVVLFIIGKVVSENIRYFS